MRTKTVEIDKDFMRIEDRVDRLRLVIGIGRRLTKQHRALSL